MTRDAASRSTPTPALGDADVLTDRHRAFLDRPRFATVATTDPNGAPRAAVVWYALERDGTILLNSRRGRRWPSNLERDPRVSIAVVDDGDGYSWLGVSGRVERIDDSDQAKEDIVALAHRYHPEGPDPADLATYRRQPRITFRIRVTAVHDHLEE